MINAEDLSQIKKEDKNIKIKEDKRDKNENKISEKKIKNQINNDAHIPSITILKDNRKENEQIIIPNIEKENKGIIVNKNDNNLVEKNL